MNWKVLSFAFLAMAFWLVPFTRAGAARPLSPGEIAATGGAYVVKPNNKKCLQSYAQHDCNDINTNVEKCSGAGDCDTCHVAGASNTHKVWRCKDFDTWNCTVQAGDAGKYECGTKWTGECYYDEDEEDWFCAPGTDTTAQCTKDLKFICN